MSTSLEVCSKCGSELVHHPNDVRIDCPSCGNKLFMEDVKPDICSKCGNHFPMGGWPFCPDHGIPHGGNLISAIHKSERPVVYVNPRTGEHRTPPRNDMDMPAQYARQGFVRQEIETHQQLKDWQKSTGLLHERSHYDPGSATAEREATAHLEPLPIRGLDAGVSEGNSSLPHAILKP